MGNLLPTLLNDCFSGCLKMFNQRLSALSVGKNAHPIIVKWSFSYK
ncbi:MAG: hypothetical protein IIU35_00710 [Neisseriaceae bacterium]|nr:hypothetical protein [Neisseriaceae bacterium]